MAQLPLLSPFLSSLGMFTYHFAGLAFAAVALFGQPATAQARCSDPSVRHEWRSLTPHQRAEWITAVKVNSLGTLLAQLTLPCPVSSRTTSQLFSGADLQHNLHRNSTRQHQQFILRRFVYTPFSRE